MTAAGLHGLLFGDAEVEEGLSDGARLQALLDFEAALAEAEAAVGVVPATCVAPIRSAARVELYDLEAIRTGAARAGNVAIPLVQQLTARVAEVDATAARYVHWGATSQDVLDTGLILQLRAVVPIVQKHLEHAAAAAAGHARHHAETPMPGRTWLQQATPTTFGLKAAGWLEGLERGRERIESALDDAMVLQLGGASGTLAALGAQGLPVAEALAKVLSLRLPDLPWHAHRDRLAHLACSLGVATGTLGKIGRDLGLLAQNEVAEAFEKPEPGRGGSSTMPHKRNPVAAAVAVAAAVRAPGLVATLLGAMPQEHERGLGGWPAEWETLPELVRLAAGASRAIADALENLVVDPGRMRANLEAARGLTTAEAIGMALAGALGRAEAHALLESASRRATEQDRPLADLLTEDPAVTTHLDAAEIRRRLSPEGYLGAARTMVERVLSRRPKEVPHA